MTEPGVRAISELAARATFVTLPSDIPRRCRDPKDDAVIATAIAGDAAFLITGDDLLVLGTVEGVRILDPAVFVALLAADAGPDAGA